MVCLEYKYCTINTILQISFTFPQWEGRFWLKDMYKEPMNVTLLGKVTMLLSKFVFRKRLSSIKGRLLSKFVSRQNFLFRQSSSSIKGRLPSKIVFHQRASPVKGHLLSKIIFRQRPSSVKGRLPSKVVVAQLASWSYERFQAELKFQVGPECGKIDEFDRKK